MMIESVPREKAEEGQKKRMAGYDKMLGMKASEQKAEIAAVQAGNKQMTAPAATEESNDSKNTSSPDDPGDSGDANKLGIINRDALNAASQESIREAISILKAVIGDGDASEAEPSVDKVIIYRDEPESSCVSAESRSAVITGLVLILGVLALKAAKKAVRKCIS